MHRHRAATGVHHLGNCSWVCHNRSARLQRGGAIHQTKTLTGIDQNLPFDGLHRANFCNNSREHNLPPPHVPFDEQIIVKLSDLHALERYRLVETRKSLSTDRWRGGAPANQLWCQEVPDFVHNTSAQR